MSLVMKLSDILNKYELPVYVKKVSWWGNFYFKIETPPVNGFVKGIRYRGNAPYDTWESTTDSSYLLYGNLNVPKRYNFAPAPQNVQRPSAPAEVSSKELADKSLASADNPNKLNLDLAAYNSSTILYIRAENGAIVPATFNRFEIKNSKYVIYVTHGGRTSFYAFPSAFVFPNRDVALKTETVHTTAQAGAAAKDIVSAYMKLPAAACPQDDRMKEDSHERSYHRTVDAHIQQDIEATEETLRSLVGAEQREENAYREILRQAREDRAVVDDYTQIRHIREMQSIEPARKRATEKKTHLTTVRRKPYFARVDCGPTLSNQHTAYIGESGVGDYVVDWRNQRIGNAYYNSSTLSMGGDIVIALKRLVDIENGVYNRFQDEINLYSQKKTDSVESTDGDIADNTDVLLTRLLLLSRQDKTAHNIIRTIQSEQYQIITHDFKENLVVNGCAGSGKTMIMYHRLSYIAYNYEGIYHRAFDPAKVRVVTPSFYFDAINTDLRKSLKLGDIVNAPYEQQINSLLSNHQFLDRVIPCLPYFSPETTKDDDGAIQFDELSQKMIEIADQCADNMYAKSRFLVWFFDRVNHELIRAGFQGIDFANFDGTQASLDRLFNGHEYFSNQVFIKKGSAPGQQSYYLPSLITSNSFENLLAALETLNKSGTTYLNRQSRIEKYEWLLRFTMSPKSKVTLTGQISTDLNGLWDLLDHSELFEKMLLLVFLQTALKLVLADNNDATYLIRCCYALVITPTAIPSHFMPMLLLTAMNKKFGPAVKGESFVFVDEYQNYAPIEFQCLKESFERPVFNLFGDLDQRITAKGITQIDEIKTIFAVPAFFNITVNYRNANEITSFINREVGKGMTPIGVHGTVLKTNAYDCKFEIKDRTAVISKNIDRAKNTMQGKINSAAVNNVFETHEILPEVFNFIELADCRGLEFDTVYVISDGMNESEKYLAYTRALENLVVIG